MLPLFQIRLLRAGGDSFPLMGGSGAVLGMVSSQGPVSQRGRPFSPGSALPVCAHSTRPQPCSPPPPTLPVGGVPWALLSSPPRATLKGASACCPTLSPRQATGRCPKGTRPPPQSALQATEPIPSVLTSRSSSQALRSHEHSTKPLYISVGHRVSLEVAVRLTRSCCKFRIPEPVRQVGGPLQGPVLSVWPPCTLSPCYPWP